MPLRRLDGAVSSSTPGCEALRRDRRSTRSAIANRPRALDEPLPWDHIDIGVSKQFLQREYKKALEVSGTPDCHVAPCTACGEICVPNWPTWAEKMGNDRFTSRVRQSESQSLRFEVPGAKR